MKNGLSLLRGLLKQLDAIVAQAGGTELRKIPGTRLGDRIEEGIAASDIGSEGVLHSDTIPEMDTVAVAGSTAVGVILALGEEGGKDAVLHVKHGHVLVDRQLKPLGWCRLEEIKYLGDIQVVADGHPVKSPIHRFVLRHEEPRRQRIGHVEGEVTHHSERGAREVSDGTQVPNQDTIWRSIRDQLEESLLGGLLGTGAQGGYNAVTTWVPTFLRTERHLSILDSAGYLAVLITGSFFGYMTGAYLSDHIGRRGTFLFFAVGAVVIVLGYTMFPIGNTAMLVLGAPLGFFGAGVFSAQGAFYAEQFPTRVRGLGQGFTYNLGRAAGALFPALVGFLSARMGLGFAIGVFAAGAYGIMAVAAFLLPETKGKVLDP